MHLPISIQRVARAARLPLIAYLLVVLLMTFIETWLVYPIPSKDRDSWSPTGYEFEDVWFTSADGTRLHGWLFEHPQPKRVILYCHGNGEHVANNGEHMNYLRKELDASVFIFDYRGYGQSEGRPTEAGVIADAIAAQRWLADRAGIEPNEVVLIGRSLGGGVAVAAAAELGAKALVLQSTFARMVDTAADLYPWLPVRLVMRNRYDSIGRIAKYDGPVLQSHGTLDEVIPYQHAKQLFAAARHAQRQWIDVPDGYHNSPQPREYYPQVRQFLDDIDDQISAGEANGRVPQPAKNGQ